MYKEAILNISDLNNKIYGHKELKQGENVGSIIESIEEQELLNISFNNYNNDNNSGFNGINKEIKF